MTQATRQATWLLFILLVGAGATAPGVMGQDAELQGAWQPEWYVLSDGTRHSVDGRIFFVGSDWTVLFFVTEGDDVRRGSAEGGRFETSGDQLVFSHEYHLSVGEAMTGLPESPLRFGVVSPSEAAREGARYAIEGTQLTVFFPSGNQMEFRRAGVP